MDVVLLLGRWVLAAVLLVAAGAKALDRAGTRTTLRAFAVPERWVAPAALALPAAEAATAAALLTATAARVGGGVALTLLGVFSGALWRTARRSGPAVACHCFGQLGGATGGTAALRRNLVLAVLAALALMGGAGASGPWWAAGLVAVAALGAAAGTARRPPGAVGRRAPAWQLPAQDGGGELGSAQLSGPTLLLFTGEGCAPCETLLGDLGRWPLAGLPRVVVLARGAAGAAAGVQVLRAPDGLAAEHGVEATPGAIIVDGRGRLRSAPALGAPGIEALARGWAAGTGGALVGARAIAFGVELELVADEPVALERALAVLPPGARRTGPLDPDAAPGARFTLLTAGPGAALYAGWTLAGRTDDPEATLELLAAAVRLHVAEHAPDRIFVHAGVVGWRGRAIVVPGRSFTGKSTLVTALLRAGATYLSDEYAVLDAAGRVHPFPKPISLRPEGTHVQEDHDPARFTSLPVGAEALPLGAVVQAPYAPEATWHPVAASSGAGAMALIANAVGVRADPPRVMAAIRLAVEGAEVLDAPRGDAAQTATALLAHLDRAPAPA